MNSILVVKEKEPIVAWKKALYVNGPLVIETDLKLINEKNPLHIKLCSSYKWHHDDSLRSLLEKMDRPLNQFEFSYYDRIREHFGEDQLDIIIKDQNAIISTWDIKVDKDNRIRPCLATLRLLSDRDYLHLSVTFRVRDVIRRLYFNMLALNKLQQECCKLLNKSQGLLFDYSNQAFCRDDDLSKVFSWKELE